MLLLAMASSAVAQNKPFSEAVGTVSYGEVKSNKGKLNFPTEVPVLTWGGDVPFFLANGGVTTAAGSIYDTMGISCKLVKGDDFLNQTRRYIHGDTPFIRGTMSQYAQASEVLNVNAKTKPIIFLQLTWSGGDHMVSRNTLKTLNDLKGAKVALQEGGPHVGFLYDILQSANLNLSDITIVWCKDLSGPNGAAEAFRNDPSISACCVITPDMLGLSGGVDAVGTGAEGTVQDAHVLVSTQQMSRSIVDMMAVRKDWYSENQDYVIKLTAGYLSACEIVVRWRREFQDTGKMSQEYKNLLQMAQDFYGKEVLPTLEVDAHGLMLDATFVGLTGNISYFKDEGNLSGFLPKMKSSLDMSQAWGFVKTRNGFESAGWDYETLARLGGIEYKPPVLREKIKAESIDVFPQEELDKRTIVTFTVSFEPNQTDFSSDTYGAEFNRALKAAADFGNGVIVIRGHSDPTKTLVDLLKSGMEKKLITREKTQQGYKYYLEGQTLDLQQTNKVIDLIKAGSFEGGSSSPKETMQAALNLSLSRAEAVKKSLIEYAKIQKVNLDVSQIQPAGAGISEPVIAKPANMDEAKKNMRVEFRIIKVPAEALDSKDFDY